MLLFNSQVFSLNDLRDVARHAESIINENRQASTSTRYAHEIGVYAILDKYLESEDHQFEALNAPRKKDYECFNCRNLATRLCIAQRNTEICFATSVAK